MTSLSDDTMGMSPEALSISKDFYEGLMEHSRGSERSLQARDFRLGISDLGFCSEKVRRMLLGQQPEPTDELLTFIGTALGRDAEEAYVARHPTTITQATVELEVPGIRRNYVFTGHPDIIDPEQRLVIDTKTAYGFSAARSSGPSLQQQFQRHMYGEAAWKMGYFGDCAAEEVRVANVWIDRAGKERRAYVHVEPLDHEYVRQAGEWFDEVVYAYAETAAGNPTEAQKEPAREVCFATCGFAPVCRAYDTDVSGLLEDQGVLAAVERYTDAAQIERAAKRLKDEAKVALTGINGSTGKHQVRWTWLNEALNEDGTVARAGHWKLDVKEIPRTHVRGQKRKGAR